MKTGDRTMVAVLDYSDKRIARCGMYGRILRCSFGGNPEDCPLHDIREWPISERIGWLEMKRDKQVLDLYNYHLRCYSVKALTQKVCEDH